MHVDNVIQTIVNRAKTRAAEMEAHAEARHNGVFHVPENFVLKAESRALNLWASSLSRLIGMVDPEPTKDASIDGVPKVAYKLIQPNGLVQPRAETVQFDNVGPGLAPTDPITGALI